MNLPSVLISPDLLAAEGQCTHCSQPIFFVDGKWHDESGFLTDICDFAPMGDKGHRPSLSQQKVAQ